MSAKINNLIGGKSIRFAVTVSILFSSFIFVPTGGFLQNSSQILGHPETKDLPRFLLQVGINNYKYARPLKGTENDVQDLQNVLNERFSTAEQKWQTLQLLNEKATHQSIKSAFKTHLIENAKENPNAIVIFQYSGHGSQVRDVSGDEPDGLDETLVPVDSRDPQKKGFDITDDELNSWFQELSKYTSNITFILDSCHSGTATRGGEATRNIEIDSRIQSKQGGTNRGEATGQTDIPNADILKSNNNYVTISAALSTEEASEIEVKQGTQVKHHGALTYYLVQALKSAAPETTYRQLMERVSPAVNQRKPQHPQAEGDIDRVLFGGAASNEDPYIKISKVDGKKITIEAGESLGIKEGTPLIIYSADRKVAPQLKGEQGKLANAVVTAVTALTSEAEIQQENSKVNKEARAVLVSSNFGTEPLQVLYETASTDKPSLLAESLTSELEGKKLIKIVQSELNKAQDVGKDKDNVSSLTTKSSLLTIRRGLFGNVFGHQTTTKNIEGSTGGDKEQKAAGEPDKNEEIYYLDENGDRKPEYNFYLRMDDKELTTKLAESLERIAMQRNLRSLTNDAAPSAIAGKLKTSVLVGNELKPRADEGADFADAQELSPNTTDYLFDQNTLFQIKIENLSKLPLYITLFNLSTSGEIKLMYPIMGAREALVPGKSILTPVYRTTAPSGYETFKVIATTSYADFSILTQKGISQRSGVGVQSPIGWLMSKAFGVASRGLEDVPKSDAWTTTNTNFRISDKVKK